MVCSFPTTDFYLNELHGLDKGPFPTKMMGAHSHISLVIYWP